MSIRLPFRSGALFALLTALTCSAAYAADGEACKEALRSESKAIRDMSWKAFDQTQGGGWRRLADMGCEAEAVSLMQDYLELMQHQLSTTQWHVAQVSAMQGKYAEAIAAARKSLHPEEWAGPGFDWNAYVLGTIAFLEGKPAELERQMSKLTGPLNRSNQAVLQRLHLCSDKSYKTAMQAPECRPAVSK